MTVGDAVYRLVLAAFPANFRARYALDMETQFRAQRLRLRRRPVALTMLWARAVADALANGFALRRGRPPSGGRRSRRMPGETFLQDLRYAARGLRRDRAVTAVVVLTLTLGLSANAVMVGLVDQLLLQAPPGVENPSQLRRVYFASERPSPDSESVDHSSYPFMAAIRDQVPAFAAASLVSRHDVTIGGGADAREATAELVNAQYFAVLNLRPALGRFFTASEDGVRDAASVAVISHGFWIRELGQRSTVIGQTLRIEDKPFTVVGVTGPGFAGLRAPAVDVWVPPGSLGRELLGKNWESPNWFNFRLVARLAPEATDELANAQATAVWRRVQAELARDGPRFGDMKAFVVPLHGLGNPNGVLPEGKVGLWLLGVAVVVLLVAMANVANVLIARTLARRREIAVRLAMGINRRRLFGQMVTEAALLTAIAAGVGLAVSYIGGRYVQHAMMPEYLWGARVVDLRALGVTLGLIALVTLGAGLAPAFYALQTNLVGSLRAAARVAPRNAGAIRAGLLIAQVSLSVLLLVGAGLFVRSLLAVRAHDVGIDLDRVILATIPERPGVPKAEFERLHLEAVSRLGTLDGVTRIAVSRVSSPMGYSSGVTVRREGETLRGRDRAPAYFAIDPEYFATLGATIEQGRSFTAEDVRGDSQVAIINRAFRDEKWRDDNPVGQCLYFGFGGSTCTRIVGVVENILLYDRVDTSNSQLYLPSTHPQVKGAAPTGMLIRTSGDAAALVPAVRQALQTLAPDMPFVPVNTLDALTARQLQPWRLGTTMFLIFGGIALVIAAVGLYSAMAYAVSQRTHEIGIRMALGASRRHVVTRIGAHGAASVAIGLVVGLLAAAWASRWLVDLLYQTSPHDPIVFATVPLVLAIAGLAAAVVPIRRSAAVDPLLILKAE